MNKKDEDRFWDNLLATVIGLMIIFADHPFLGLLAVVLLWQ